MWPTVFEIPWFHLPIRGYGLMLMIGFLGGTWWAAKRAARVKADPDLVINLGFAALIASVIGARAFYVIHYWDQSFAGRGFRAVVDITAGGMEFYGGFIGAFIAVLGYLWIRKVSFRLYLDIITPSLMFGMGMARIGCFLNGCCWGAVCDPQIPWAVSFPYASPAAYRQWEERVITYPAELISVYRTGQAGLIDRDDLRVSLERRRGPEYAHRKAAEALQEAQLHQADSQTLEKLRKQVESTRKRMNEAANEYLALTNQEWKYMQTPSEVLEHARDGRTHVVHPVQLYASLDGLLLAIVLNELFYRRKQHGLVTGVFFLAYPIMRFIEEIIRSDNPHDVIGLTISQFVSLAIFTGGIIYLVAIYRMPPKAAMPAPARAPAQSRKQPAAARR